jgi:hypothetical protein
MDDPQSGIQLFHTWWSAVITVAGAIVAFFTKRLVDEIDEKADRCDVADLRQDIRDFLDRQERQHESNTKRLDQIIMELGRGDR